MCSTVLVYIEINNKKIEKVTEEIISKIKSVNENAEINGVLLCDEKTKSELSDDLSLLPLNKIYVLTDSVFDTFQTCVYAKSLAEFVRNNCPDILLMGATENGRDLAPRTASMLDIGLTADCTDIEIDEQNNLLATRPTYGGKMMATIVSKTRPNFATIRPGAFKTQKSDISTNEVVTIHPENPGIEYLYEVINCTPKPQIEDWTCSEIIVSGGLGLKSKDNFELIYKLCDIIHAKPAATRAAIELGWAEPSIQVGQTGNSISPKLYIAFGISGAMQHMVGITNSDKIIAINTDKNAPIMKAADIAIVADAELVLKSLIKHCS